MIKKHLVLVFIILFALSAISVIANGDDQAASDAEAARQQAESDAESAGQQAESDAESSRQQEESDAESAGQQAESDAESSRQQEESDAESARQQAESDIKSAEQQAASDAEAAEEEKITEEKTTFIDENGNTVVRITKTEIKDGETITEIEERVTSPLGTVTISKTKTEIKDGETITEFESKVTGADGSESITKSKTEIKEGQEETQSERKFTGSDGKEVIIKTKTEVENGEEETTNLIEVTGARVETKLSIKAESKEAETILKAELSTGAEQDIIVLPNEALQIALDELQTTNDLIIEIKEFSDNDVLKVVFSATAAKPGKILGIFDVTADLETLIDIETGEIIKTTKPWWAFLVVGENEETICHISGRSGTTTTVLITEIKDRLAQGDSIGNCPVVCGDDLLVDPEVCESGDVEVCVMGGYAGTGTCNNACSGFTCIATESCGDGIINGLEACDDGNVLDGDGCSGSCQIEASAGNENAAG